MLYARATEHPRFADLSVHLTPNAAPAQELALQIRQRRQHQGQGQAHEAPGQCARGRRQGGPAARPGHPVLTGALHCCSCASTSTSTSSPTFNCPLPRLRPQETTRRPQRGHHRQGLRSEWRAARRPTDYGLWGQGQGQGWWLVGWWHVSCGCIACG